MVAGADADEIIAIEKSPNGMYVSTSERNYAFTHPDLAEAGWSR